MQTVAQQTQLGHVGPAHELSTGRKALEPHERFAGLLGHSLRMLTMCRTNFTRVGPFLKILVETVGLMEALHAETGLLPRFPMRCLAAGKVALLYYFAGKVAESLPHMTQCLRLAQRDPLVRCCYPLVVSSKTSAPPPLPCSSCATPSPPRLPSRRWLSRPLRRSPTSAPRNCKRCRPSQA